MWDAIVETAIRRKVDAVVLTGDVVDRENRFFEAIGPLERGLTSLGAANIDTFAVSGNHDFDVLPGLVDALNEPTFHLLGRDGQWETAELRRQGEPVAKFLGWSFPEEHVLADPLDLLGEIDPSGLPTVALIHGDLDVPQSRYAPLSSRRLRAVPVAAWLLGHIHAPRLIDDNAGPTILYPGSPQAMDPGETGTHGPWLMEIEPGARPRFKQLPLSRVCYDALDIDLTGVNEKSAFRTRYFDTLRTRLNHLTANAPSLEFVVWRVRLTGRTGCHGQLNEFLGEIDAEFELTRGQTTGIVERNTVDSRLAIDLNELARATDPPGTLAKVLLELDAPSVDDPSQALLQDAIEAIERARQSNAYAQVTEDSPPTRDEARRLLVQQGMFLLDALMTRKEHQ